jgi:putative transposase
MRIPRRLILGPDSVFHLVWRGHNREWVLRTPKEKDAYLRFVMRALAKWKKRPVRLFSFCLMSNHPHLTGQIDPGESNIFTLSKIFQSANSLFGRWYNRLHHRSGKVAEDRFKTLRIQDDQSLRRVMCYSDANPVRAGIVKHPREYPWSSYRYYAHGERSPYTGFLSEPGWYHELGRTSTLRQRAYRRLIDFYLRSVGLLRDGAMTRGHFIGRESFIVTHEIELRQALRLLRASLSSVSRL